MNQTTNTIDPVDWDEALRKCLAHADQDEVLTSHVAAQKILEQRAIKSEALISKQGRLIEAIRSANASSAQGRQEPPIKS